MGVQAQSKKKVEALLNFRLHGEAAGMVSTARIERPPSI
jgi:hypothetical protein